MLQTQSQFLARRRNKILIAVLTALCLLLFTTIGALANTVNIDDAAHVLNADQVRSAAANLPDPINIYTTNTFSGSQSALEQRAISHITNPNLLVMAIDTQNRHLAIVGGSNVPLSNSQYGDAVQAFKSAYGNGDYTGATVAAIGSLRSALGAAPVAPSNNPGGNTPVTASGGFFSGFGTLALCFVGLLIVGIVVVIFGAMRRRSRLGGQPVMSPPYVQPYNQGYPPGYNQGYPPNYGPGYNQGGMNPWVAGGLGAAGGGLLGYELGKEEGEEQARQGQSGNLGGGNDFGGGASGDFGGGGGGDFGGGSSGDFGGGGGGGDFGGGGGGGDFGGGGGSSGSF